MSTIGGSYGQYGTYQKGYDYNLFYTKNRAKFVFSASLTTATSGNYLPRRGTFSASGAGSKAIYVPAETFGAGIINGYLFDADNADATFRLFSSDIVFENDGGTMTVGGSKDIEVDTDVHVVLSENASVDGLQFNVTEESGTQLVYVYVELDLMWLNNTYLGGIPENLFPAAGAAITADETPVAQEVTINGN